MRLHALEFLMRDAAAAAREARGRPALRSALRGFRATRDGDAGAGSGLELRLGLGLGLS